jgi:hypothetical protein
MPVFRLTPRNNADSSRMWEASAIIPQCLWVFAQDESSARDMVAKATAVASERPRRGEKIKSPWRDPALVACDFDETKSVASGIIRISYGLKVHAAVQARNTEAELRC